jgi:hypothetical protein
MKWVVALVSPPVIVCGLSFGWWLLAAGWKDLSPEKRPVVVLLVLLLHVSAFWVAYAAVMIWKADSKIRDLLKEE